MRHRQFANFLLKEGWGNYSLALTALLDLMCRLAGTFNRSILVAGLVMSSLYAQGQAKTAPSAGTSPQQAIELAAKGRCNEALPVLKRAAGHVPDMQLRYHAAVAQARCAMSLNDTQSAVSALLLLRRDFPRDPEVLYMCTHYFSELANRAAQELATTAPSSYQVQKLNAEALESQSKWDEAETVYRRIIEQNPQLPDIHYRLAQIILDRPATASSTEDARKELEAELKIAPENASAEFMLGELARRDGQWDSAIEHFSRASKLDAGFSEAYLALGMSLNSASRFSDAIPPLERYVKMEDSDPAGHYQLAMAYARTGNKTAAARESDLQRKAAEKAALNPH